MARSALIDDAGEEPRPIIGVAKEGDDCASVSERIEEDGDLERYNNSINKQGLDNCKNKTDTL